MLLSCSRSFSEEEEEEEEKEDGEIVDLADSRIYRFSCVLATIKTYREIEYSSRNMMVYFKRLRSSGFVSLEAFKMYYVMRTFAPSLHRKSTDFSDIV